MDAIAEFKVFRNQFDAQYGKATTAVVSVVTKAGTNQMSGSAYYFGRDKALNARNAFATGAPPFKQTRAGYSFGGPIVQNRTHFFSAYEGLFVNTSDITSLGGVPSELHALEKDQVEAIRDYMKSGRPVLARATLGSAPR